ncbi:hypothetical protein OAD66_07975 [Bacteroidia bacterium]|nr:hypothetical protein [Bacteroidia bacterium]
MFQLKAWNYYLDNISNTALFKIDYDRDSSYYGGVMYLIQNPMNQGGNKDVLNTFHDDPNNTHLLSARLGYHFKFCDVHH